MPATDPIPPTGPPAAETFEVQQLKAMEQPKWNEGRLDDLNKRVDDGIGRLDEERKELRGEMKEGFARVDGDIKDLRTETKEGFEKVDEDLKGMQRLMVHGTIAISSSMVLGFVTMATVMVVKL